MSKSFFSSFKNVSEKAWKQKIQADLKGADYNETLVWNSIEGIDVKPFYHADSFDAIQNGSTTEATVWKICQSIYVADVAKSNKKAVNALNRGAESIKFTIPNPEVYNDELLKDIDLNTTPIYFELEFLSSAFVKQVAAIPSKAGIHINTDIIGNLAKTGNWFNNLHDDHNAIESIVNQTSTISVDLSLYQNSGATIVQQLAYTLSHTNEYLNHLNNLDTQTTQSKHVTFSVSVGSNYFFEIAKLRALRILWKTLASEYYESVNDCQIVVTPSKRNKTLYDYNTNMLRTTTECMSAILGGANTICNLAYDSIYHKDNEFGERISRNQLLLLKHESYFDKVNNPSDGAYYIESLTKQFVEKSLVLFKDIESNGGFLKQLKEGLIQRKIKESAAIEQEEFNNGHIVLLGTNKHPNQDDLMASELELFPFVKIKPRKTLIEPIIPKRLAEKMEQERLKSEDK